MKYRLIVRSFLIAISAFIAFVGGTRCNKKKESLPFSTDSISVPYQELIDAKLIFYDDSLLQWELKADIMRKPLTDTGKMLAYPVDITIFDSSGNVSTRVLADSGSTDGTMEYFKAWGNVLVRTKDSMTVRSEKLWWSKEQRRIESDTFVQIETVKGDILRGKGLDALEDFTRFSFKSEVSGEFPDFKRRVETEEESLF